MYTVNYCLHYRSTAIVEILTLSVTGVGVSPYPLAQFRPLATAGKVSFCSRSDRWW